MCAGGGAGAGASGRATRLLDDDEDQDAASPVIQPFQQPASKHGSAGTARRLDSDSAREQDHADEGVEGPASPGAASGRAVLDDEEEL